VKIRMLQTEKALGLSGLNTYVFSVPVSASKNDISEHFAREFKLAVARVNTCRYDGKRKAFRGRIGRRQDWKKAYVTFVAGQELGFN